MKHSIEQYRIDNENGIDTWRLDQFAEQCGTKIVPVFPIFIVLTDGQLSAFYYAKPVISITPNVAPEELFESPRAFYQTAKAIVWYTRNFGSPLWLVGEDSKLANPKLLSKVGLTRRPLTVWET